MDSRVSYFQNELIIELLKQIVKLLEVKPAVRFSLKFEKEKGNQNMPLTIQLGVTTEKYFVIGDDSGNNPGAALATGQTCTVVSSDTTTVNFTPDAAPALDVEGTQSIASGSVVPVKVGGPVTATCSVLNADGTVFTSITDTVTVIPVTPGTLETVGVLFEEPMAIGSLVKKKS